LTRAAFEIERVLRVEIHCDPENKASAAVPRKLGYTHEAILRKRIPTAQGEFRDSMIWSLLVEDYPSTLSARAALTAYDAAGRKILECVA
jgi:RimJ/RimL family protein N-acetyltransferase